MAKQIADYVCIRECFAFNKHFMPGDDFPQDWLTRGYEPNKHFAKAAIAYDEIERVKHERALYGHGDDIRSTVELKAALRKFTEFPEKWTRKQVWAELMRHESAEARDKPQPPPKSPRNQPKKA